MLIDFSRDLHGLVQVALGSAAVVLPCDRPSRIGGSPHAPYVILGYTLPGGSGRNTGQFSTSPIRCVGRRRFRPIKSEGRSIQGNARSPIAGVMGFEAFYCRPRDEYS
ncbi:MAG: hypothetical protein K0U78_02460 [Actinomycetia bacterium]|nr:hypothetical protein [Actinomycetes bacterium]